MEVIKNRTITEMKDFPDGPMVKAHTSPAGGRGSVLVGN